jgi:hypothetical protein
VVIKSEFASSADIANTATFFDRVNYGSPLYFVLFRDCVGRHCDKEQNDFKAERERILSRGNMHKYGLSIFLLLSSFISTYLA